MKYEGIIFDLDGTLVDSLSDIAQSMNNVLKSSGLPTHTLEEYQYFIGDGIRTLVQRALPEKYQDSKNVSSFYEAMMKEYREHIVDQTKPYAGIEGLLYELQNHHLQLAILSNKFDDLTKVVAKHLFGSFDFVEVIGAKDHVPRKPDPYAAQLISDKFKLAPAKVIFVGDTGIDMQTAKNAGMLGVGVAWGYRTKEELIKSGADHVIDHPSELLNLFD